MKYMSRVLVGLIAASAVLNCAKVEPSKIELTPITDTTMISQEHLSGAAGAFGGMWKGSGTGSVIKDQGTSEMQIKIDQAEGALTVLFQGDLSTGAHFKYDFGKFRINGNTLSSVDNPASAGMIGSKAFVIHDSKNSADLSLRRDNLGNALFKLVAQERLASGKFVQYRFEGNLKL